MSGYSSLDARGFLLHTGDAGAVAELAVLCVQRKPDRVAPRLYAHAHERKLSEIGMQHGRRTCTCNMYIPWR